MCERETKRELYARSRTPALRLIRRASVQATRGRSGSNQGRASPVPLAAAIGVLVRFAVQLYLDSSVYKGSSLAAADGGAVPVAKDKS